MISRFDAKKYPTADPVKYLKALSGVDINIDPVFKGRLAAFARDHKAILEINSGYRSIERQKELFFAQGGKYDPKLGYYWPSTIPASKRTVAKPGSSFHNFRLAVDTSSAWAKQIDKDAATSMQKELLKYGLFKPMTKGNGCSVIEDWHIQPIETLNVPLEQRMGIMPIDERLKPAAVIRKGAKGDVVMVLQYKLQTLGYKLSMDGDFGAITEGAVKDYQRNRGLASDGVVGTITWNKLYEV